MAIKEVTPQQAHDILTNDSSAVYIHVRTEGEFANGHQAGFKDLSALLGGFGGMRDSTGKISAPGWASSGLPVSNDNGEGVSYQSLSAKVR